MTTMLNKIKAFHQGRDPRHVALKYQIMRSNPFKFYRGSCSLFYDDLPADAIVQQSPASWSCGDLHLENMGCFKADNRAVYFDINDFDESALTPCLFDVARLLTSIFLASNTIKIDKKIAMQLSEHFLMVYGQTLQDGTAKLMERKLATGILKDFLRTIQTRKRRDFIAKRTVWKAGQLQLAAIKGHLYPIATDKKQRIIDAVASWAVHQPNPKFYTVLDVGARVAGMASLGLERYVLLIEGNGEKEHYLLDMKQAVPSCLLPYLKLKQPLWRNEATRIIQIQKRMQLFPNALLHSIEVDKQWFVLKELQPSQDKMDLSRCNGRLKALRLIITTFASIVGWDQLRSSGREGAVTADELIAFGASVGEWGGALMQFSEAYMRQVITDYEVYSDAYDDGYFAV